MLRDPNRSDVLCVYMCVCVCLCVYFCVCVCVCVGVGVACSTNIEDYMAPTLG